MNPDLFYVALGLLVFGALLLLADALDERVLEKQRS